MSTVLTADRLPWVSFHGRGMHGSRCAPFPGSFTCDMLEPGGMFRVASRRCECAV